MYSLSQTQVYPSGVFMKSSSVHVGLSLKTEYEGIPTVKPTRFTNFTDYLFLHDTLHVSEGLSVHHQKLKTVHTVTGICQTDTAICG
jgi:hypothetical protein